MTGGCVHMHWYRCGLVPSADPRRWPEVLKEQVCLLLVCAIAFACLACLVHENSTGVELFI